MSREHDDGQLEAYLDGALSDVERARLEARLAREPELARALAEARRVRDRAAALLETLQLPAGRGVPPDLATIRARARSGGGSGASRGPRFAPMAWAAALVGVIGVALALQRLERDDRAATAPSDAVAASEAVVDSAVVVTTDSAVSVVADAAPAPAPAATTAEPRRAARDARAAAPAVVAPAAPAAATAPAGGAPMVAEAPPAVVAEKGVVASTPPAPPPPAAPPAALQRADDGGGARARGEEFRERAGVREARERDAVDRAVAERTAGERAAASRAARAAPGALTLAEATALLGAAPWRLADAALVSITRLAPDAVEGAVGARALLAVGFREASGRDVTLLQQRAERDDPDEGPAGWRTRDGLRVRLSGTFTPATRDSLWARLRR